MKFLHPAALTGLLFIVFPVLIHFLSKKKYRPWESSLFYIIHRDLKRHIRLQNIKNMLSLILKILSITFLTIGAASPTVGDANLKTIFVDTSPSMELVKEKLSEVLNKENEKFAFIDAISNQPFKDAQKLSKRPLLRTDLLKIPEGSLLIGDGRYPEEIARVINSKKIKVVLLHNLKEGSNFVLEKVQISPPVAYLTKALEVTLQINNEAIQNKASPTPATCSVSLTLGGRKVLLTALSLKPGKNTVKVRIEAPEKLRKLQNNLSYLEITLSGDEYSYDNNLVIPVPVAKKIKIFSNTPLLKQLVNSSPYFEAVNSTEESDINLVEAESPYPWSITFLKSGKKYHTVEGKFLPGVAPELRVLKNSLKKVPYPESKHGKFKNLIEKIKGKTLAVKKSASPKEKVPLVKEADNFYMMGFPFQPPFSENPEAVAMTHILVEKLFAKKALQNVIMAEAGEELSLKGLPLSNIMKEPMTNETFPILYDENTILFVPSTGVLIARTTVGENVIFANYNKKELIPVNNSLKYFSQKKVNPSKNLSIEFIMAGVILAFLSLIFF